EISALSQSGLGGALRAPLGPVVAARASSLRTPSRPTPRLRTRVPRDGHGLAHDPTFCARGPSVFHISARDERAFPYRTIGRSTCRRAITSHTTTIVSDESPPPRAKRVLKRGVGAGRSAVYPEARLAARSGQRGTSRATTGP